jgi:hypothetical protein
MVKEVLGKFHGRSAPITREETNILGELREMRSKSRLAMKAMFNANFGSTFLTDTAKESAFAYNVQRYADIYTSRLENFLFLSSDAWLYTPFDVKILPHHVKVTSSTCGAVKPSDFISCSNTIIYFLDWTCVFVLTTCKK